MTLRAKEWILVNGEITSNVIDTSEFRYGSDTHYARIEYKYSYGGLSYIGDRISFGFRSWSIVLLVWGPYSEIILNYPNAKVYVNPKSPEISCLIAGIRTFHLASALLFLVWNIFAYVVFIE